MKKIWKVPVTWEMYGVVEVEASSKEEAIEVIKKDATDISLPDEKYYVDDSFGLSCDDMEELKSMVEEA